MTPEDAGGDSARYRQPTWLRDRVRSILEFYYPACVDDRYGGFVAQLDEETGEVYDPESKHLVATARFTANFAVGHCLDGPEWCEPMAERGLRSLADAFYDPDVGGYHWLLEGTEPVDRSRTCYGHAFVLLATARATEAGIDGARARLDEAHDILVERFWEPDHGLFEHERSPDWSEGADYRGQNENMHACEALLAAHSATGDDEFLERARTVADGIVRRLAAETEGLIWEHYETDWTHDFAYNRDEPRDQFRPWGYQPGHLLEWAKLLAILDRRIDDDWPIDRATALFDAAIDDGWDEVHGGFYYTVDREGEPIVADTYGWPVAEAIGAAAALSERTGRARYRDWYDRCWGYAEAHLTAPGSNWYQKCTHENDPIETEPGPAVEPGYHPIGACFEAIRSVEWVGGAGADGDR